MYDKRRTEEQPINGQGNVAFDVEDDVILDDIESRDVWSGKLDFILSCVGYAVGLGNIWRFPYLCYKNGGGAFFIPYLLFLVCGGIPILMLEVGLGQYTRLGGLAAWNICPLFQGIGVATLVVNALLYIYYIIILSWAAYYLVHSFSTVLPWSTCNNDWNTDRCSPHSSRLILNNQTAGVISTNVSSNISSNILSNLTSAFNVPSDLTNTSTVDPTVEFWDSTEVKMAEAPSPDPEVQFKAPVGDEVGQGDQDIPQEINIGHRIPLHTPIAEREPAFGPRRIFHDFNESPPRHAFRVYAQDGGNDLDRGHDAPLLMKPTSYDGKEDWDEYISHFQDCAELGRWSDRTKLLLLAASLRGQARTFYMSLSGEDKQSYPHLVSKLNQRFGSTRNQNRWLSKLEMRKRLPGESIAVLGDDIRQMAQRAYHNLNCRAQEALALNQLYKVIPVEMKCRCIDKECQTVADAVDVIERYESIMADSTDKKKMNVRAIECDDEKTRLLRKGNSDSTSNDSLASALKQLMTRIDRLEHNNTSEADQANLSYHNKRTGTCYICNSPKHFMRSCPNRYNYQMRPNQGNFKSTPGNQGNGKPLSH
ncbi:hypothetical protein FSP39_016311 [Pinctada imbricata]|uniref:Transporter n=1 Tax=Pinctada imbricata TaxID=66713 RepID=A0AA88XLB3_PINIB|nr:hypothetical protein FSP39_016311 [Pinctada imbricata]